MFRLYWDNTDSVKLWGSVPSVKLSVSIEIMYMHRIKKKSQSHKLFGVKIVAQHIITGQKVAVKILNKGKIKHMEMAEKVRREINILKMCTHPHICRL